MRRRTKAVKSKNDDILFMPETADGMERHIVLLPASEKGSLTSCPSSRVAKLTLVSKYHNTISYVLGSQTVMNGENTPDKNILPVVASWIAVVEAGKTSPFASSRIFSHPQP